MVLIDWVNANPGVSALIMIALCFAVFLLVFMRMNARRQKRMSAMLKKLDARVYEGNNRVLSGMRLVNQSMGNAALQLNATAESMDARQDRLRREIDEKLELARVSSEAKLDEMQSALGARMQSTLETRLGESFKLVSGQLESVYKGLGEMRTLAEGVGDLKRVLAGVKTRGTWGEVRLRALMEECLTDAQYAENVEVVPGSGERVEFAVSLPGKGEGAPVYLPVDSKFPQEDYLRLVEAGEKGDARESVKRGQAFENAVLEQAKRIQLKYIHAPYTTDFAVMFLPVESLYGEVLSRGGLCENMQKKYHVLPAGPSSFSALLNCLQMGFRTLAVEKRSAEILRMLGGVRQEFARFGDTLDKARTRLEQAAGDLDSVGARTRAINRRLTALGDEDLPAPKE